MRAIFMMGTALLALAGCDGGAGDANRGNATTPAPTGLASPDGRSEVRSDAAFSGLPQGIPAYPRMRAGGAVQIGGADDEAEMRVMAFRTDDPAADVIAFYAEAAERAGFRVVNRADAGPRMTLGLARDDGDAMNVTANGTPTGTSVQIMAGRERNRR
jgi:hypothetical protein